MYARAVSAAAHLSPVPHLAGTFGQPCWAEPLEHRALGTDGEADTDGVMC